MVGKSRRFTNRWVPGVVSVAFAVGLLAVAGPAGSTPSSKTAPDISAGIKPYSGFESQYPHNFPVPKVVAGKHYTIGCQNPVGAGNQATATFCSAVAAEAKALGMRYIGLEDNLSVATQVSNFNQLIAQGANAIVIYPLAPDALRASLAHAKSQGVVVVGLNVTFTQNGKAPGYDTQVWEGRDEEAYLSVAQMALIAPHAKVVIIGIASPVPALKYLAQRYKYWAKKFGLQVLGEQDNATDDIPGGALAMTGLLARFPTINGVLAYNDESAVGGYTAARSEGRTGIKIIGINGSSVGTTAVRAGQVAAIVQVDEVGQGAEAAMAAYALLTKQHLPLANVVVRPPHVIITKANVVSAASWSKELASIKPGHLLPS
jgi:ABC-type sugar transport system substrate-binding protein